MSLVKYSPNVGTYPTDDTEGGDTQSEDPKESATVASTDTEEVERVKQAYEDDSPSEGSAFSSASSGIYYEPRHRAYSFVSSSDESDYKPRYGAFPTHYYDYSPKDRLDPLESDPQSLITPPPESIRSTKASSAKRARILDSDTDTLASRNVERQYANFPSRDQDERPLRSIRRQTSIPKAVNSWCVRDLAWLDSKLSEEAPDKLPIYGRGMNYTPYPHIPAKHGMLSVSLGVVDMRPDNPHWEGINVSDLRNLDVWFLAGAQHCLRSQSSLSPEFFIRFREIEAFEANIKSILNASWSHYFAKNGTGFAKTLFKDILGVSYPIKKVEDLEDRLQHKRREYLRLCLLVCYNLKRLRYWLWREYNREYQRLVIGLLLLTKVVHQTLEDLGQLNGDDVVESLELLKLLPIPIVPVYQRHSLSHEELVKAAKRMFALYPSTNDEKISYVARLAFDVKGTNFENWTELELKLYAYPEDALWRTLDLQYVKPKTSEFDHWRPTPWYHETKSVHRVVKFRWMEQMKPFVDIRREYRSRVGDYFNMKLPPRNALESIWKKITAQDDLYIYKVPQKLRRTKSLPNMNHKKKRLGRLLFDDHDTSNLGFDLDYLPARPPPRMYNGKPPPHPAQIGDTEFVPLKDGPTSQSFIVIGWFPGESTEPIEMCMWYTKPRKFLRKLRTQINHLRGWRRFLSLKTVQEFQLYKCSLTERSHSFVETSASTDAVLRQFHKACFSKKLRRDGQESEEWAKWATTELNNWQGEGNSFYFPMPMESHLSLRLITKWSRYRLILASTIPMALSLGMGFYYMQVTGDVQTAWTVSGYIVTAGAFLIAVLSVLTIVQDGGDVLGKKKRGPDPGNGV